MPRILVLRLAGLLLASLLAAPLHAATLRGVVSHVTDGDTLWVRPAGGGESVEIRLLDLDAPEGCQLFGAESKKALAERVLNQPVVVRTRGQDDYQRSLGRVRHKGQDVNAWLVRQGYAWSATYRGQPGPYARLEEEARRAQRGLWAMAGAQEPRSFRKRFGRCHH